MKNFIKSSLSVLVILTIIFSLYSPALALDSTKMQILENIGAVPAEDFSDEKIVTRAEFIKMAVMLLYDDALTVRYDSTPFSDVSAENEYCQYIGAAYSNGLISGTGGAQFNPDMPMKYIDAVKIMVDALGYGTVVKLDAGYEKGYAAMAAKINLSTKALALSQTALTGKLTKELLHDSLDVYMADTTFTSNGDYTLHNSGITLMDAIGIYCVKGVLTANEYTGLYKINGAGESKITVGGVTASLYNSLDDEKYIGYNVECYYKKTDNENVVVSILPTGSNKVTVIPARDFEDYNGDYISYYEDDKLSKAKLNAKKFVIYNGRIKDDYTKATFDIAEGTITAIDNSGDGYADVINVRSYDNYIIKGIDKDNMILYDRFGKILDLSEESKKSVVIADSKGNEIDFEDIAKHQILSVMADSDFNYIRIMVSTDKLSGSITSISDEGAITVENGEEYELSECIPKTEIAEYKKLSQKGTFYIDAFGRIAYFVKDTSSPLYSMIIEKDEGGSFRKAAIKFIDVNSAVHISTVSKKCKLNGVRADKSADVCAALDNKEMVIIELNDENEIISVETADGNLLNAINDVENLSYSGGPRWFGQRLTISATTPVFIYPSGSNTDEDEYFVWNYRYLAETSVDVQGFNTKKESYLPDVVAIEAITDTKKFVKYNSTNLIVNKLLQGTDIEGEDIYILSAYTFGGTERKYKIPVDVLSGITVKPGDMIKVGTDRLGKVRAADKFYDAESGAIYSDSKYASSGTTAGFKPMVGYVYELRNSFLGFSASAGEAGYNDVIYYSASSVSVSVLEVENKYVSVKSGSLDMLTDYVTSKNPSKVFMYSNEGSLKQIIILK